MLPSRYLRGVCMKETTNAKMKLPEYTDPVDIADINSNFEIIDQYLGAIGSGGSDNIFIAEYNSAPTFVFKGLSEL